MQSLFLLGGVFAQSVTPPRFNGTDINLFLARLTASAERIAIEERIPYDSLPSEMAIAFRIDQTGAVENWRVIDNTCEGDDSCGVEPATQTARQLMRRAFEGMEGTWSPALQDGRPVGYRLRLTIRIPVERIERTQNPDPLLFLGRNPDESFHDWVRIRVRHDGRFEGKEGLTRIRFFIEPDGRITIDEVLQTPDERQAKEIIRVIRNSRKHWTPRKVDGVPQRTEYVYGINLT